MTRPHSTLPRIDPRRPWVLGPTGLKRIVLGANEGNRDANLTTEQGVKPLRSAGPFSQRLLVVSHSERGQLDEAAREAIAAAALLAKGDTEVALLLFGVDPKGPNAEEMAALAVDRVWWTNDPGFAPEYKLACVTAVWQQQPPQQVLFADRGEDADLGRRFACRQALSVLSDVVEIASDGIRRREAGAQFSIQDTAQVLLLARGVADMRLPFSGQGVLAKLDFPELAQITETVHDLGSQASPAAQVALEEADLILSAGNGVQDVTGFLRLAAHLGAATGASRVAVDDGRFPRSKQVGATGKTVQASAYIALGISGAVQHLQGIKACRHVIAVNLDAAAPIAKRADLTIVDDCQAFMGALEQLTCQAQQEKTS